MHAGTSTCYSPRRAYAHLETPICPTRLDALAVYIYANFTGPSLARWLHKYETFITSLSNLAVLLNKCRQPPQIRLCSLSLPIRSKILRVLSHQAGREYPLRKFTPLLFRFHSGLNARKALLYRVVNEIDNPGPLRFLRCRFKSAWSDRV